jgi:hypothetical protein
MSDRYLLENTGPEIKALLKDLVDSGTKLTADKKALEISKSLRTTTGSLELDDSISLSSNSHIISSNDLARNEHHDFVVGTYKHAEGTVENPMWYLKGPEQVFNVSLLEDQESGTIESVLPTQNDVHFHSFKIKPVQSGTGKFTLKFGSSTGKTLVSEFQFTVEPAQAGTEFEIMLPNALLLHAGENIYVSYSGIPVKCHTYSGHPVFGNETVPYLKTMSNPVTKKRILFLGSPGGPRLNDAGIFKSNSDLPSDIPDKDFAFVLSTGTWWEKENGSWTDTGSPNKHGTPIHVPEVLNTAALPVPNNLASNIVFNEQTNSFWYWDTVSQTVNKWKNTDSRRSSDFIQREIDTSLIVKDHHVLPNGVDLRNLTYEQAFAAITDYIDGSHGPDTYKSPKVAKFEIAGLQHDYPVGSPDIIGSFNVSYKLEGSANLKPNTLRIHFVGGRILAPVLTQDDNENTTTITINSADINESVANEKILRIDAISTRNQQIQSDFKIGIVDDHEYIYIGQSTANTLGDLDIKSLPIKLTVPGTGDVIENKIPAYIGNLRFYICYKAGIVLDKIEIDGLVQTGGFTNIGTKDLNGHAFEVFQSNNPINISGSVLEVRFL